MRLNKTHINILNWIRTQHYDREHFKKHKLQNCRRMESFKEVVKGFMFSKLCLSFNKQISDLHYLVFVNRWVHDLPRLDLANQAFIFSIEPSHILEPMYQSDTNIEQWKGKSSSVFNYFAVLTFKMCCIKKTVLKNFAKFTEKNLCIVTFLLKLKASVTLAQVFFMFLAQSIP